MGIDEFKKDLKALLEKHNAQIFLNFDDSSDTHGMTGVEMSVQLKDGRQTKEHCLSWGYSVDARDIKK